MKSSSWWLAGIAVAVVFGSCVSTDVPPAPDLEPVLEAYANPTAVVDGQIMGEVAEEIAKAAEGIQNSEIFEEILNLIIEIEQELDNATSRTCNGGANNGNTCTDDADCPDGTCGTKLVIGGVCSGGTNDGGECADDTDCPGGGTCAGGVTLTTPRGFIKVDYICSGWDERQFEPDYLRTCRGGPNDGSACNEDTEDADCPDGTCEGPPPDSANGRIELFMTLDSGGIGRVVWGGTAGTCLYLVPNEGDNCDAGCSQASYDGGIALDLGPDWVGQDVSELPATFVVEGNIGFDGDDFPINQSFRVVLAVESGLVILVDIGDPSLSETFNYIFTADAQAIRDATGLFGCSLEDRRCFDEEDNTIIRW